MIDKKSGGRRTAALLILAIVFLVNPTVKVVDIFPDFIACFIIVKYLGYPADRAPFFEEARGAFLKLGFVSLAKIPAFLIISYARSVNTADNDTAVLFTFVFSVIEIILFYIAVKNIFRGLYYLGERSDASSLLAPFSVSKKGKRTMTPEKLQNFALGFAVLRCAACALPEMLLLSRSIDTGAYVQVLNPARYYPYSIVLAVLAVFIVSIIFAKRAAAYIRAVASEGEFFSAADSLIGPEREDELQRKLKVKSICGTMTAFTVASFFTVELCFDNFNNVNLVPHFIYGGILLFALVSLKKHTEVRIGAYISVGLYCFIAAVGYFMQIHFLDTYGYEALVKDGAARAAYLPIIILSAVEFALLCAGVAFMCLTLSGLVTRHTGLSVDSERYSRSDAENHKKMKIKVCILGGCAMFAGATKLADVILKYYSDLTLVATDTGIGNVVSGLVPWFNLVVLFGTVLYCGYSLYLFSAIKEEVEMKYS